MDSIPSSNTLPSMSSTPSSPWESTSTSKTLSPTRVYVEVPATPPGVSYKTPSVDDDTVIMETPLAKGSKFRESSPTPKTKSLRPQKRRKANHVRSHEPSRACIPDHIYQNQWTPGVSIPEFDYRPPIHATTCFKLPPKINEIAGSRNNQTKRNNDESKWVDKGHTFSTSKLETVAGPRTIIESPGIQPRLSEVRANVITILSVVLTLIKGHLIKNHANFDANSFDTLQEKLVHKNHVNIELEAEEESHIKLEYSPVASTLDKSIRDDF